MIILGENENLQEVAGQIERGTLHVTLDVQILANDSGQRSFADFSQLGLGELGDGVIVFIPAI